MSVSPLAMSYLIIVNYPIETLVLITITTILALVLLFGQKPTGIKNNLTLNSCWQQKKPKEINKPGLYLSSF